ncbi:MAG: response regulator transcription factor, partial [Mesorhizobium sp.]
MRILLIEDDNDLGGAVREHLVAGGHAVDWAKNLSKSRDHAAVAGY